MAGIKKGVIMVAGKGTRLLPVTENISKCMLPVAGKPIMQYSLECMAGLGVRDVCIVLKGEHRGHIEGCFGASFSGMSLTYVEQDQKRKGTASAVLAAEGFVGDGPALIMAGDIITEFADVKRLADARASNGEGAYMLLKGVDEPKRFGIAVLEGNRIIDIIEKPDEPKSNLANASVYIIDGSFLEELRRVGLSSRGEYEITSALYSFSNSGRLYGTVAQGYWNDIGTPWGLLDANEHFMGQAADSRKGVIRDSVLTGNIVVEEGAEVFSSYIEGPCFIAKGAKVGPYAHVRRFSYIGPGCEVGGFTVVKNSILLEGVKAKHLSYIGDSIIGGGCNFGSSAQVANLRFDRKTVRMRLNGDEYDSGRTKLGCVIGHNVNFGISCILLPGRKVGGGSIIGPGVIVSEDVPSGTRVVQRQALDRSQITEK